MVFQNSGRFVADKSTGGAGYETLIFVYRKRHPESATDLELGLALQSRLHSIYLQLQSTLALRRIILAHLHRIIPITIINNANY